MIDFIELPDPGTFSRKWKVTFEISAELGEIYQYRSGEVYFWQRQSFLAISTENVQKILDFMRLVADPTKRL